MMSLNEPEATSHYAKAIIATMDENMMYRVLHSNSLEYVLNDQQQGVVELIDNDTLPDEVTDDIIEFESKELYHHFLDLESNRLEEIVDECTNAFRQRLCEYFAEVFEEELHNVKTITIPMYEHRIKSLQEEDFTEWDG
jgi:hypothetical protein